MQRSIPAFEQPIPSLSSMKVSTMELPQEVTHHSLSLVVPLYNEKDNVIPLVDAVETALRDTPWPWQLILVDDGSRDGTRQRLQEVTARSPGQVCAVLLRRNFGQTAAMQ